MNPIKHLAALRRLAKHSALDQSTRDQVQLAMSSAVPTAREVPIDASLKAALLALRDHETPAIGELFGHAVYLDHEKRMLTVGELTFSVDHPYLEGTTLRESALRELAEKSPETQKSPGPRGAGAS